MVRVVAALADLAAFQGRSTLFAGPPELPPPDECPELGAGLTEVPIAQRFRYRGTHPPGWLQGQPSGNPTMEFWIGFSDGRPLDTLALPALVDAAPPRCWNWGRSPPPFSSPSTCGDAPPGSGPPPGWLPGS